MLWWDQLMIQKLVFFFFYAEIARLKVSLVLKQSIHVQNIPNFSTILLSWSYYQQTQQTYHTLCLDLLDSSSCHKVLRDTLSGACSFASEIFP